MGALVWRDPAPDRLVLSGGAWPDKTGADKFASGKVYGFSGTQSQLPWLSIPGPSLCPGVPASWKWPPENFQGLSRTRSGRVE